MQQTEKVLWHRQPSSKLSFAASEGGGRRLHFPCLEVLGGGADESAQSQGLFVLLLNSAAPRAPSPSPSW